MATDGAGDPVELHDRGMSVAARGYVCEAHVTAADDARFVVRVVAPGWTAGHAGISADILGPAARRVARAGRAALRGASVPGRRGLPLRRQQPVRLAAGVEASIRLARARPTGR